VPGGFDPAAQVTHAVSGTAYRQAVSVRVHGSQKVARMRMPGSIATVEPVTGEPGGCGRDGEFSGSTGSRRSRPGSTARSSSRNPTNHASEYARSPDNSQRMPKPGDSPNSAGPHPSYPIERPGPQAASRAGHPPLRRRARRRSEQIIPICVISAGSDDIGEAVQNESSLLLLSSSCQGFL
jgi:hypothetical protein